MDHPLVSCLCPTYNRLEFLPRMLRCFQSQTYPNLELIMLDDGNDGTREMFEGLTDPRIKYFYELPKKCHSTKMNRCFELSTGEYGIVWDSDDWYPPDRVKRQVEPLIADPKLVVSGSSTLYYYEYGTEKAWRYMGRGTAWLGAFAMRRSVWETLKFDNDPRAGADNRLLQRIPREAWCDLKDPGLVVASIHGQNDCKKVLTSSYVSEPWEVVRKLIES